MKGKLLKSFSFVLLCLIMLVTFSITDEPLYAEPSDVVKNDAAKLESVFTDIDTNSQLYPYVRYITENKLINGFPDGTYRPDENVTRAQLAAIAVKVKGLPMAVPDSQTFNDVTPGYWAYGVIETAAGAGIFRGYPDGSFNPEGIITNAEAAVILTALSGGALTDEAPAIGDVGPEHWAYRQVATAVRAGLAETAPGNLFNPDQGFSRRALARGLGMACTRGPSLRGAELTGELTVKKGTVTVTAGEGDPIKVAGSIKVLAGTKIVTGTDGQAEITYADGTGLLIEADSELTVGTGRGMKYIRLDGMPGVTIDQLQIRLEKGRIFGALATMYGQASLTADTREETPRGRNLSARKGLLASTSIMPDVGLLLAQNGAAEENIDWWDQPVAQRTRVVVDMPWGVAGIRGTFWRNEVGSAGQSTSLITGSAVITAGGRSVSLGGGQSTTITSFGAPPAAPVALTQAERQAWQEVRNWVQQRAQEIQNNLPVAPSAAVPLQPNEQLQPPALPNIVDLVTQSLNQATLNTGDSEQSLDQDSGPVSEDVSLADWTANGLWRAVDQNSGIKNMAIGKYVSLPEGDSSGGYLPNAPSGGKCFWYGLNSSENNYAVGNYLNEQAESDQDFSGGTSTGEHSGVLTSPLFSVPQVSEGQIPILSFKSWWEIEGVNPDDFDQMKVYVSKEGSKLLLGKLNPLPSNGGEPHLPYTSGGYNQPAAWKSYTFSLDGCQGSQVQFAFEFSTGDSQFNGFRGWLIDQVKVEAISTGSVSGKVTDGTNPVEGAEVTVSLGGQEYNGITGADGSYLIGGMIPGSGYMVTASKEGYLEGSVTGVSVSSGQETAGIDIALEFEVAFKNVQTTETTARFFWMAPGGISSIQLQQSSDGGNSWEDAQVYGGTLDISETTALVTGLAADTDYMFKLVIFTGSTSYSSILEVRTRPELTGEGTAGDPYIIYAPESLDRVRNELAAHYMVGADIDLDIPPYNDGEGWLPIDGFTGTFDGCGYRISNLFINRPAQNHIGLFGNASGGSISNTVVENVFVTGGQYYTACLVGESVDLTIEGCSVIGSVYIVGGDYTGGFVGLGETTTVTGSRFSGIVIGGEYTGGLTGCADCSVADCVVNADVTGADYTGGLNGCGNMDITDTTCEVNVNGGEYTAGMVGCGDVQMDNSGVIGTISGGSYTGGLIGIGGGSINESFARVGLTGADYTGGLAGSSGATISSSFTGGSVVGSVYSGGLVGEYYGLMTDAYSSSQVEGHDFTGGLMGILCDEGTLTNTYAAGPVTGNSQTGGLVGDNDSGAVNNSYYDLEVTGQSDNGVGSPQTTEEMKTPGTYLNWDFDTIWMINVGDYPRLRFFDY